MRTLIWIILIFGLAVGVALLANSNQGYVLIVVPPWRISVSLNFWLLFLLLGFIFMYGLANLVMRTVALPGRVSDLRQARRQQKAEAALRDAVRALFAGRYAEAIKQAQHAFDRGSAGQEVAALVAARAAHALQDDTRYSIWLARTSEATEDIGEARLMTEAELAVEARHFDLAQTRLTQLRQTGHRSIAAQRLALRVSTALEDWEAVLRLARQLRKHKALSAEQVAPILRYAHLAQLKELAGDPSALEALWRRIPSAEQEDRRLVEKAIPILVSAHLSVLARKTLEKTLEAQWDSALVLLYGQCGQQDPTLSLARAETWLPKHPEDPNLLYALGQLCMAAQLWGKAERYFSASLAIQETLQTHLALARLFEQTDREEEAQIHFRAAARFL